MSKRKSNVLLENKKTSELLDRLHDLTKYDRDYSKEEELEREEIKEELLFREPFYSLNYPNDNGDSLEEIVEEFSEDIKKLKRHKHDEKTGDVTVRI